MALHFTRNSFFVLIDPVKNIKARTITTHHYWMGGTSPPLILDFPTLIHTTFDDM